MRNYWTGTFIYNYFLYIITIVFFILNGTYVFGLNLFKETNFLLIFLTLFIWGFAQIGLSFFYQAFLNNGRTASIVGYMLTAWLTISAAALNSALFTPPREAPYIMNILPSFAICRIFFI